MFPRTSPNAGAAAGPAAWRHPPATSPHSLQSHFLFNVLNSISALVRAGRNDEAADALAGLARLHAAIVEQAGAPQVRLAWELGIIQRYLDLERLRFGDHLQLSIEIGPGAGDAPVPPLLLLPLVENAVKHGVARRDGGGGVAVRAFREGDRLRIVVRNDAGAPGAPPAAGTGFGLRSVYQRLTAAYGDDARLAYIPDHPDGVTVTLELPFKP